MKKILVGLVFVFGLAVLPGCKSSGCGCGTSVRCCGKAKCNVRCTSCGKEVPCEKMTAKCTGCGAILAASTMMEKCPKHLKAGCDGEMTAKCACGREIRCGDMMTSTGGKYKCPGCNKEIDTATMTCRCSKCGLEVKCGDVMKCDKCGKPAHWTGKCEKCAKG